jgi:hypothetical protein
MIREVLAQSPYWLAAAVSFFICASVFACAFTQALRSRKEDFRAHEEMPLND